MVVGNVDQSILPLLTSHNGHSGDVDGSTLLLLTGRMVILTSDNDKC